MSVANIFDASGIIKTQLLPDGGAPNVTMDASGVALLNLGAAQIVAGGTGPSLTLEPGAYVIVSAIKFTNDLLPIPAVINNFYYGVLVGGFEGLSCNAFVTKGNFFLGQEISYTHFIKVDASNTTVYAQYGVFDDNGAPGNATPGSNGYVKITAYKLLTEV